MPVARFAETPGTPRFRLRDAVHRWKRTIRSNLGEMIDFNDGSRSLSPSMKLLAFLILLSGCSIAAEKPNVLFLFADDMTWKAVNV